MKAILVLEMPSKCSDCQFYYQTYDEDDDYVSKCEVLNDMTIDGFIDKYSGCPLKPMPEKKKERYGMNRQTSTGHWETYGEETDSVAAGYNACIDEILGDKE